MLFVALAFAADPLVEARWNAGVARLVVTPRAGEHVNQEAPALFANGTEEVRGRGALEWARLPARGVLRAEVPVCTDDQRVCRLVTVEAAVSGPSGRATLSAPITSVNSPSGAFVATSPASGGGESGAFVATSPASGGGQLATRATGGGAVRIYDFSAVWCPPCNQMKAEVLEDPTNAAALAAYAVEVLDADDPASWPLKSRYNVGGYPTLIAVDVTGAEVDRYLGYVSEPDLVGWIAGLSTRVPISALRDGQAAGDPAEAALRLVRAGELEPARPWLARASPGSTPYHWAHLLLDPAPADADWLLAHAPNGDWLYEVLSRWPERWPEAATRVASLDASLAASCLDAYAAGAPKDGALLARVAAAALLRTRLGTDPAAAKGFVLDRADLLAHVGDIDGAIALLDEYDLLFPNEFTFDFAASRLLLDAKRLPEAEIRARAALDAAWGDQRLRAVQRLARALDGQGRRSEAVNALKTELTRAPRPDAATKVRTSRYLAEVEKLLSELGG